MSSHSSEAGWTNLLLVLLILTVLLPVGNAHASDSRSMRFSHITHEDGLSQSFVYAMAQDRDGFMWLGTQEGLNRFDGHNFRIYAEDPDNPEALADDGIRTLFLDDTGLLWIGTDAGGLSAFDPVTETFKTYLHDPTDRTSIADNLVRVVMEDSAGNLWVGTDGSGLDRLDRDTGIFEHFPHDPLDPGSLAGGHVWDIAQRNDGTLWVATSEGLSRFNPIEKTFTNFRHDQDDPASLSDSRLRALFEDSRGDLWIGTLTGGLNRFDDDTSTFERFEHRAEDPSSLSSNQVNAIFEDDDGVLWVGTDRGLNAWNPESMSFSSYREDPVDPDSIANDNVLSIFQDHGGVLWVGTYEGLSLWNPTTRAMLHYRQDANDPSSLSSNVVTSFTEDATGRVWVGTFGGGINILDREVGRFSRLVHDPEDDSSISSNRVMALLTDSTGTIWAGTRNAGLNRIDADGVTRYVHDSADPTSLCADGVSYLIEDSGKAGLWVATFGGGLCYFDRSAGAFTGFRHDPEDSSSISSDRILHLFEDSSQTLWVGTFGGSLNRFDRANGNFERIEAEPRRNDGLSGNEIYLITEDPSGDLWIAAKGGGLNRWSKQDRDQGNVTFERFSEIDGLPNATIYSGTWDEQGNLWMSTGRGLSCLDVVTREFRNFTTDDGLQGNEFNFAAGYGSSDGSLFFGGLNGFNAFDPAALTAKGRAPRVAITSLLSLNEPVDLTESRRDGVAVALRHDEYLVSFEFAALDFAAPLRHRFMYRLDGLDSDWIDAGNRRQATYTNLPAGDYTFRVRAGNGDGTWSVDEATLSLHVQPAPWASWWAYLLYALAILMLVLAMIRSFRQRAMQAATLRYATELEQVETRLNTAQRIATIGNWEWELDTGECWWSDELYRILGLDPRDVAPSIEHFLDRVHPDDRETTRSTIEKSIDAKDSFAIVQRVVRPDRKERIVRCRAEFVEEYNGRGQTMAGTIHDITERQLAEDEIVRFADFQKLLAEVSSNLIQGTPEQIEQQVRKGLRITGAHYGIDSVSTWWVSDDGTRANLEFRWSHGGDENLAESYTLEKLGWVNETLSASKPVILDDVQALADTGCDGAALIRETRARSILTLPIVLNDVTVGAVSFICFRKKKSWSPKTVEELTLISEAIGGALARLRGVVEIQRLKEKLQEENYYLRSEVMLSHKFSEIVGEDEGLKHCLQMVEKVAPSDAAALILGESGTGKELIARSIHELSSRRDRPMISVNCPALPSTLIESELFGHEKGAFTGATSKRPGRFELAEGGTLFLDEIGELSLDLQAKLLRVLQTGEYERLGGSKTRVANVRLIAATNRDLRSATVSGEFRDDLFYRINSFPIELPPLRDRSGDIPLLAEHFVRKHAGRLNKTITAISARMISELNNYEWPGNIRELESVIVRALISAGDNSVLRLPEPLPDQGSVTSNGNGSSSPEYEERSHIIAVLESAGWKISGPQGAAEKLGLAPSTLRSRMKKLGISRDG
ncbi:MAG: sigma 54-interacting transcriptional regulator [Woeseiaceae bacterium]|nr:sigma 54-interacting transcriptional regulator [Woeseiaceae bacterium]